MKRALLGGLSTLLLPFSAHAAATAAGGYLMRGGYQSRSYMRMDHGAGTGALTPASTSARSTPRPVPKAAPADATALAIQQRDAITELVVIDGSVADKATLYRGLKPGVAAVEIDPARPGLPQLVDALRGYRGLGAIHVVSHASAGVLQLGSSRVDAEAMRGELATMQALRGAVRDGADLLFYGCDLAADAAGESLLDIVRQGTGMDVAASADLTGEQAQGGDWELEVRHGDVQTPLAFSDKALADFSDVLAASNGTKTPSSWSGFGTPTLSSTDFRMTATDGTGAIQTFGTSGGDTYMMLANGAANHYFYVKADGTNTGAFELTGLLASEYAFSGLNFTNVRVVGVRQDGSTITSATINGTGSAGEDFSFDAGTLAGFSGTKLKGFKLYFDCAAACTGQDVGSFSFTNFTIQGAVAPLPVVTDGRISLSGASGTGGAYKIGDAVTATWNNTAAGDNNTGITGVTVDFSQFGGGSAVAASNTSNTWKATYTLTSGSIDNTGRNVSVTATNGAGNTTTADTTNATVDSIAPTVTDGRINISGASGTGGAYKIGDTVVATWNNTAAGDNNTDTISSVTVNFTAFGGGAAVSASNTAGTWTASYPIVAGSIDATNANVTVTATDNAGNATSTADTTNATVDNIAPSVTSITPAGGAQSTDTTVDFIVDFNETVSNVSTDDFTREVTGSAAGTVASVSASSGDPVTVTVSGISGSGTLKVNLNGSTNIVDDVGNAIAAYTGGSTHTVNILTAPAAPTIGAATAGDGQVSVAFTAPASNGGSAITGYTVTSSPGGISGGGNGFTTSPITVTGLANGTPYTFTVTATNAVGTSPSSSATAAVTPKADQAITFGNPGAQNFGSSPTLSATSSSGLAVSFSSSTTGVCTITSAGVLTFVTAGSCTINADQAGNVSTNAAATVSQTFTVNAIVPGAPTIGMATAGDTQADVSFTPPASNGGATITGYTVTSNPDGFTGTGAGSPITVTGLTNGVSYTFTVTATNSAGTGAASGASNSITPASPQTIVFANPGTQSFGTSPDLSILGGGASSTSGLTVTFSSSTTGVCTITSGGVLTFVTAGTCTINADQAGDSSYLPALQVSHSFTVNPIVPGAPSIGTAIAGDTQASVAFTAPANTGGTTITGYTVTVSPADVGPVNGASSPIVVTGLTNGQAYTFTVTADNSAGTGPASGASNSITPKAIQTITFVNPGAQNFGTTPTLTATSDSGLLPTFTSSTTGVCTITGGGELTFVTAGTCTINADQAGNGSYLAATQVSRTFTVNAVVPGAPAIGTATVTGAGQVSVAFTAPASTGGVAIDSYTVTSSPDGITASGAGSPVTISGLTPGTSYTFTVYASNSVGDSTLSGASNSVTPAPALVAGAVSTTVAYGSGGLVTLAITGTATSVAVASGPAHGTAVASGTTITYTPAPGYAGPDSFTYTASDAFTTSPAATVSITVAAPSLALGPASLPAATASNAYTQAVAASGGAAPYHYALTAGALPEGLTLSADGTLAGTATAAGSFAFAITATDSSSGQGPFTVVRNYSLQVEAPALVLDESLPPATGASDYRAPLTARGGTAPYRFALLAGALPTGLSLAESGEIAGEPTAAGTFAFTVQVTDANGFTGTQAYSFTVEAATQAITAFVATPAAPTYAEGGTFAVSASGGGSGNPVVFASTTPAVCGVQGSTVTMLAAGTCVLTADQAGNAMYAAAAQVRLEVAIAAAVPVLAWIEDLAKVYGQDAFDLPDPDSPSPGAFTFASANPAVATVSGRTVTLVGEGTAVLTATQAATAGYTAASVQLTLTVGARPDPTTDRQVAGTVQAQVDAAVRFAQIQSGNIRDRLRQVRTGQNRSAFNVALAYAGNEHIPGMSMPVGRAAESAVPTLPQGWGVWAAGTATFGTAGRGGGGFDFSTGGLTFGADRALGEHALLGLAASWGRQDTDFDDTPSKAEADQASLAVYGLWRSGEHLFVDGMLARGRLDFDLTRWSELAGDSAHGSRQGTQWFGSLTVGYEHRAASGMSLTGYGRYDGQRATLDGYAETGLGALDLAYGEQGVDTSALAVGLEGSHAFKGLRSQWRPFWTVEYRQALENQGSVDINYVRQPLAQDYRLALRSYNDDALALGAGLDLQLDSGWMFSLLLGHEQGRNALRSNSIGLQVRYGGQAGPTYVDEPGLGYEEQQRRRCQGRATAAGRCSNPTAMRQEGL